jgi:predicted TIM-barrel fold metal-dependent hydrolase
MMARRIVDAHVHIFPPDVCARREAYHTRDAWFGVLYENPKALLASPEDLIASMDAAGIETSIACGFPWADPGICREHSAWMADAKRRYPGRIEFLAIVAPTDPGAARDAERAFEMGAVGIGELNADAQRFDLLQPQTFADLMEVCREREKPVMLHATEPIGHAYPGKGGSTPERLVVMLDAYPTQPIVLAHWGGGLPFYELMPEVRKVTHFVSYDSAATTYLYNSAVFPHVLSLVGADRVLFASDYAILRQDRLVRRVEQVLEDHEALQHVFAANADRMYGLGSREDVTG